LINWINFDAARLIGLNVMNAFVATIRKRAFTLLDLLLLNRG